MLGNIFRKRCSNVGEKLRFNGGAFTFVVLYKYYWTRSVNKIDKGVQVKVIRDGKKSGNIFCEKYEDQILGFPISAERIIDAITPVPVRSQT